MDRDRERERRLRDIPPEDRYGTGGGQSYRPGAARDRSPPSRRSPPRADSYRGGRDRSPPRASGFVDSYAPGRAAARPRSRTPPRGDSYRRRSPSPARYRDAGRGGDSYRARPRSPPRREELPRDDLFRREPPRGRDFRDERDAYRDARPAYRDGRDGFRERDARDRGFAPRSPPGAYRERSPLPVKRGREPSPVTSRGRRTPPPPLKRERLASPVSRSRYDDFTPSRGVSPSRRAYSPPRDRRPSPPPRGVTRDYRLRSRSPLARSDRVDPRAVDDWRRPRSPSPPRAIRQDYYDDDNGRASAATSRRSSPPVHPSRLGLQPSTVDDRPAPARDPYGDERQPYRARSPPRRRSPDPMDYEQGQSSGYLNGDDRVPPPREPYRADDIPTSRPPPTGPGGYRTPSTMAPPTGPAAAQAAVSISAHARAPVAPPSGPRGDVAPRGGFAPRGRGGFGGDFAPRGRGSGFGGFRGGRGGGPPPPAFGRGNSFDQREAEFNAPTGPAVVGGAPPSGPRGSFGQSQAPAMPFRPSNTAAISTGVRSQRFAPNGAPIPDAPPTGPKSAGPGGAPPPFSRRTTQQIPPTGPSASSSSAGGLGGNIPTGPSADRSRASSAPTVHPAIADLPKIIDGGQRLDPLVDRTRLGKLEEESERLRRQIEEREAKKRRAVREWDRLQREADVAGLRSELAEQSVRELSGEGEGMAAF